KTDLGHFLFTRRGYIYVNRVFGAFELSKGDVVLVEDGQRVMKDDPVIRKADGAEIKSPSISYAKVLEGKLLLIAQEQKVEIRNGSEVVVTKGQILLANETIATFDPFNDPIISEHDGIARYEDIVPGSTLKEEINAETGNVEKIITDVGSERDTKEPRILITDEAGNDIETYYCRKARMSM
ncbi:hypothetical protein, partial [Geotalea toluenoxydans]|uniref:hypothetical protein n=1 Tax=Geotalea toluenoxydans TaxID=421624 RepID=UPI000AACD06E